MGYEERSTHPTNNYPRLLKIQKIFILGLIFDYYRLKIALKRQKELLYFSVMVS
jgi:hypothetical protein